MAYMNQQKKAELVALAKPVLKKYGVKATFGVNHYSGIVCRIQSGEIDFLNEMIRNRYTENLTELKGHEVSENWIDDNYTGVAKEFLKELSDAINTGNWDKSDMMTDYFDIGWYTYIKLGKWNKPYVNTKKIIKDNPILESAKKIATALNNGTF